MASAQGPCGQICEADIRCGSMDTQAACVTDCVNEVDGWVRQDALETIADCLSGLACTADDDQCLAMVPALQEHRDWAAACNAKLAPCDGFDADFCSIDPGSGDEGFIRVFAPVVMREMTACLTDNNACTIYATCLEAVFTKYGIDV